jgi:hypothetical protein
MNVGDHRNLRLPCDRGQRLDIVLAGHGHPHDLAAGRGQLRDLLQGRVDVGVSVVVIDCTLTGAPPPTGIEPTMICRLCRRGASGGMGVDCMPRLTAVTAHLGS